MKQNPHVWWKFHSPLWWSIGLVICIVLIVDAVWSIGYSHQPFFPFQVGGVFRIVLGLGLGIHLIEVMHRRRVKPVKYITNRIIWYLGALKFAWSSNAFKFWIILCTVGIVIGLVVGIGMTQLVILVAIATMGWSLEIANTAIEHLCDLVEPNENPKVKIVKDAFGAVPAFIFTSYLVTWGILVIPTLVEKVS